MIPDHNNRLLASDIEANNLLYEVTKLWCIVSKDVITNELFVFHDFPELCGSEVYDDYDQRTYTIPKRTGTFDEGVQFWYNVANNGGRIIVHNGFAYDKPVIEKFYKGFITPKHAWVDTLIQSKNQWYDRPPVKGCKGIHGLDAWGGRFGINKPAVTDWSTMDAFKLHRCIADVDIQLKTFLYLEKERRALAKKGIDVTGGLAVDSEYVINVTKQEQNGALLDVEHIKNCLVELDSKIEELRKEIEPQLPKTVKGKANGKMFKREIMEYLGVKVSARTKNDVKESWSTGKLEYVEYKSFYKPTKAYIKTEKGKHYRGFHDKYGASPQFDKRTDFVAWRNSNYPKTKPKEWDVIVNDYEVKTLNEATCEWFGLEPTDTDKVVGAFTKIEILDSTMNQQDVIKKFLLSLGWQPTEYTYKKDSKKQLVRDNKGQLVPNSPKLTEDSFESLPEGVGKMIADYNTYCHRRRYLANEDDDSKGILHLKRSNDRIGCGVNVFGTATGRSSHYGIVNLPSESALYGENLRKCIIAPEDKQLVGADQKSSQLSIAAYYALNWDYYQAVASGQEVTEDGKYLGQSAHCFSSRAFGLVSDDEWKEAVSNQEPDLLKSISLRRKKSKGASFGVIFGCSGKKLAGMLGVRESEGQAKKEMFLEQMGLDGVADWLGNCKNKYGRSKGFYIPIPFGAWVYCSAPHKAINYLIQGTEAVCQKVAINYFEDQIVKRGLTEHCKSIGDFHDEKLCEISIGYGDEVGKLLGEAYTYASDKCYEWHLANPDLFPNKGKPLFKFDLDGGYEIGKNYYEVH